jgi:polyisoprenoid-binding protein YceI
MKKLKIITTLFLAFLACSAFMAPAPTGLLKTHTGHIWFFSKGATENIEAHNKQVGSSLNTATGDMLFSVAIKSFEFEKEKMQEHFNENYMESDKYPKSTFKGKVSDISKVNFKKDGAYNVNVSGDLMIHGVTKKVSAPGTLTVKGDEVTAKSKFMVALKDYNISIPTAVTQKIAENIEINVDISYKAE